MKTQLRWVYLEDQLPRIGSGWRDVFVKVGRKWAYFTFRPTGARQRLAKAKALVILEASERMINRSKMFRPA